MSFRPTVVSDPFDPPEPIVVIPPARDDERPFGRLMAVICSLAAVVVVGGLSPLLWPTFVRRTEEQLRRFGRPPAFETGLMAAEPTARAMPPLRAPVARAAAPSTKTPATRPPARVARNAALRAPGAAPAARRTVVSRAPADTMKRPTLHAALPASISVASAGTRAPPLADSQATSAAPGWLVVSSKPWGELWIDGRSAGSTPQARVWLSPGTHKVEVARDGYKTFTASVAIVTGQELRLTRLALEPIRP